MIINESLQKGSVRKKGNQWYYRFRVQDPDGTWRQREFKGGKTKKETNLMLKQAISDYKFGGNIFDLGNITVAELCEQWWNSEIENSALASNSRNSLINAINHIKCHSLGKTKLPNLTIEAIQAYVDLKSYGTFDQKGKRMVKAYAESTLRKHFYVLNGIFKFAVYPKKFLRENPMQYVKKRKKETTATIFGDDNNEKVQTITHEEFKKIIYMVKGDEKLCHYALPLQIAYLTGLRSGEICGLNWEDIDLNNQRLVVRRSMYYDDKTKCWELKVPKNHKSRIVDFGDSLTTILKETKQQQVAQQVKYGLYYHNHFMQQKEIQGRMHWQIFTKACSKSGNISSRVTKGKFINETEKNQPMQQLFFVCSKQDGELLTTQSLKYCNKVIKRLLPEISHFHFHCLRHTYASTLINHGANMKDVQELLGHSDIKITMNTYSHVTNDSRKMAIDILEKTINI